MFNIRKVEFHLVHTSKHRDPQQGTITTLAQAQKKEDLVAEPLIYLIAQHIL